MSGRLEGKSVLVTGAARGQGAAAVRRFVAEGARVVIADVRDEEGKALADELGSESGGAARYLRLDVTSEDDWAAALPAGEPLDVLVNNAGVLHFGLLADTSLADYQRVISVNQVGTFLGMRAAVPAMRAAGGGSIVNVSSVEGLAAAPLLTAYTASKFAIRGMTKVAAVELGQYGIRVNSVHPGMIDTDMIKDAVGRVELDLSRITRRVPLRRTGRAAEIADLVVFLASDESSYCTGAEFVADGGATATHALNVT